jgi:uncharacterized membrane protein
VPGAVSPMIWAIGAAPRLLFPARLLDRLDGEQRVALLLHELAHVRQRDHWVRLVELLVVTLYWWHPVVWWARRELREAEEQCCDAWVVWASRGEGHAYARALLETVAFVSHARCPLPAAASGIGYVSQLRRRLTMIMQGNTPRSLSALGWIVVLTLGLCLLPLAAQAEQPKKSGGDEKDQEIQTLKQKLRAVEQAKRQEAQAARQAERAAREAAKNATRSADSKESTEVKQAMETAAELKRLIGEKRKELEVLQAKLNATLEQLDAHKKGGKVKVKELKERKDLKDMKDFGQFKAIDAKKLAEEIQESIRNNPDLKKLQDLKKLGELKGLDMDLKKLDELKKLGNIKLDFKELDVLKKQLGDIKGLDAKQRDEIKKTMKKEFDRAIQKDRERVSKDKGRKAEDIDARLDRLMKEINELRREIHEGKGKQVK